MAVNLIDSNDIQVAQTGNNIELQIDSDIKNAITENTSNIADAQQDITNLENGNVYSTNEVNTGKVWIDGKPIYRRVVTTIGSSQIDTTSFNIDMMIKIDGIISYGNNEGYHPLNAYGNQNFYSLIQYSKMYNRIQIFGATNYNNQTAYITIEYTKTTD